MIGDNQQLDEEEEQRREEELSGMGGGNDNISDMSANVGSTGGSESLEDLKDAEENNAYGDGITGGDPFESGAASESTGSPEAGDTSIDQAVQESTNNEPSVETGGEPDVSENEGPSNEVETVDKDQYTAGDVGLDSL